jgi:hypothetical protein
MLCHLKIIVIAIQIIMIVVIMKKSISLGIKDGDNLISCLNQVFNGYKDT